MSLATTGPALRATLEEGGSLLRLVLARPKGNVIDAAMIAELRAALAAHRAAPGLRSVLLEGEGGHFSFGASVPEHLPGQVEAMLPAFHALARELCGCGKVVLAAVRGQCLGGGLELALLAQRLVAAPDARLGQPEIKLAVFAPLASLLLPRRIGQPRADDLLLTGRTLDAREALACGLVDEIADDPAAAALEWHRRYLLPLSAAALEQAVLAARHELRRALEQDLPALERQYLQRLMATADAREGLQAFIQRRTPTWTHR
jgi:cyclohexa-1,5-dienecarbonyl-CoA hydratase